MSELLRFLVPKGSMMDRTIAILQAAGYAIRSSAGRDYRLGVSDRVEFLLRDREEIPILLAQVPAFHAGVTGADLLVEAEAEAAGVWAYCNLQYSRKTNEPTKWVLAGPEHMPIEEWESPARRGRRIGTEKPNLARKALGDRLRDDDVIIRIRGTEELAIADGRCDAVFLVTETGESLRYNGLRVLYDRLFVSTAQVMCAPHLSREHPLFRQVRKLALGMQSVLAAQQVLMVKFVIYRDQLDRLKAERRLTGEISPTQSRTFDPDWYVAEIKIDHINLPETQLLLQEEYGARAIASTPLTGYIAGVELAKTP